VVIRGQRPWLRITLAEDDASLPFVRCRGDCTVFVHPSDYWLTVGATADLPEGSRRIEIEGPTELRVTPREERARSGGLGLAGVMSLGGGAGLIAVAALSENNENRGGVLALGLVSMATGLVLTIIAIARGRTSAPDVEARPLR
jgi:hypothetical protein